MNIVLHELREFSPEIQEFLVGVAKDLNPVMNWVETQRRIMLAPYRENRGLSGKDILRIYEEGGDDEGRVKDGDIDLYCTAFHSLSNTIAYTYVNGTRKWLNTYYLEKARKNGLPGRAKVAGTLMHETAHRFEFYHRYPWQKRKTVPYIIGDIVEDCFNLYWQSFASSNAVMKSFLVGAPHPFTGSVPVPGKLITLGVRVAND